MNWTEQQQTAIDARGSSFVVSAAAGSGKTAVLTERLVQLLSDKESGVRADRIAAVTFTNASASDLKKKLDKRFRQLINDYPSEPFLLRQQVLLQSAKISTINAFCFDILRDNITDQGITSGFGVLEETDEKVIKAQAMDELFDMYSREKYETISYLYDKFCLNDHQPLVDTILGADNFLSSVAMGEKWLDKAISEYKNEFVESVYFEPFFEDICKKLREAVRLAQENLSLINDIFSDMTVKPAQKSLLQAQEDLLRTESILTLAENRRFPDDEEIAYGASFGTLVQVRGNVQHNAALRDIFKKRRDKIKKIIGSVIPSFSSAPQDFSESGRVAEFLCEAVKDFRKIVWEKKCAKNAISFDDGERLLLELLADIDSEGNIVRTEAAERISEFYDIILVDEYQDSNNKQDLIFKLISKGFRIDEKGRAVYGTNAFVVGDVKQSIYRFRQANPKNFLEAVDSSEEYTPESNAPNKFILLNKNFRSSPEVVDFVNFVFGRLMTRTCGECDYTDAEKLYFGAGEYGGDGHEERLTRINLIDTDSNAYSDESIENIEAEMTADKIADMLRRRVQVTENDGSKRDCTFGDFCVLVRTNPAAAVYAKALEKRGIPVKGSDEKGYLKSREISVLTNLLRIIANPLKDVPLASVMVSPMYPFEMKDLAILRTKDKNLSLYSLVRAAADREFSDVEEELCSRCREFVESIAGFRLNAVTMTVSELINHIYDTTDFISVMQQYTDGEKKRANLRLLIHYAQSYEKSSAVDGTGGLSGFVAHLDRVLERDDFYQGKGAADSGDHVVVQTLHKSKGLEYPFVIIAEAGRGFEYDSDVIMCSDDGRMGFVLCEKKYLRRYKTFQQTMLSSEGKRDTRSEELRLLYVGLTRAKQQLFINLRCGSNEKTKLKSLIEECVVCGSDISSLAESAESFADWFWLALMMHGDFAAIVDALELDIGQFGLPSFDCDEKIFDFEICDGKEKIEFKAEEVISEKADPELVDKITKMFDSKYDRTLSETPAKLSVTQIVKKFGENEQLDLRLKRPKFISESRNMTGSERGTAIHTFFQYCSFENAIADTTAEITRLTENGFLTKAQAECISVEKIRAFFATELYKRICSADHIEREKKFTVAVAELNISDSVFDRLRSSDGMIKGIIDLMYEDMDGIVIVDYKSDRGMKEDELRERYRRQLEIYKSALELTTGKKVIGLSLYSIELEKEIVIM